MKLHRITLWIVCSPLGLTVIKNHFGTLCSSLPSNYKKTVKRLQQLTDLAEEDMMLILSLTDDQLSDPVAVNQRILIYLFMNCQSCDQLLDVHRILEDLIDPVDHLSIYNFQQGKIQLHVCAHTYRCSYVCIYTCDCVDLRNLASKHNYIATAKY